MEYKVEIKFDENIEKDISDKIIKAAEFLRAEALSYLLESIPYVTGQMLRSISWETEIREDLIHTVIYSDPNKIKKSEYYPLIVEMGSSPHDVPLKVLVKWAELKYGLDEVEAKKLAKIVRRGIRKRGNVAYYYFRDTSEYIQKNWSEIVDGVFRNT
jgi:hypothetical protein